MVVSVEGICDPFWWEEVYRERVGTIRGKEGVSQVLK
jgi:hypothetical protein